MVSSIIKENSQVAYNCFISTSWENLFMPYANNKGADLPVQPLLFAAWVV